MTVISVQIGPGVLRYTDVYRIHLHEQAAGTRLVAKRKQFMYCVGFSFWRVVAGTGILLRFRVCVDNDKESGTYRAESEYPEVLVVSGNTLEQFRNEVPSAGPAQLEPDLDGASAHATVDRRERSVLSADAGRATAPKCLDN